MIDLSKLKNITENMSILYVEDSAILAKRMGGFLKKIFKEVYIAENGEIGLQIYKKQQPNLVITDLNMPVMDGHTMILNLKKIDANVTIIVLSAYSDTDHLLKSIHLGIADFIPKPVDNKLLLNILFKVCSKIVKNIAKEQISMVEDIQNKLNTNHDFLMKKLETICKSGIAVEFINHYKGVPIIDKGKIIGIDDQSITIIAPYLQSLAIKNAESTLIKSEFLDLPLEATLQTIHPYNDSLVLNNINIAYNIDKKREQLAVVPNDGFSMVLNNKNKDIAFSINLILVDSVELFIKSEDLELQVGDDIDIQISLDFVDDTDTHIIKKIITQGEVYSIVPNGETSLVTIIFHLEDLEKEDLEKYIIQRRLELIVEFKQLRKV